MAAPSLLAPDGFAVRPSSTSRYAEGRRRRRSRMRLSPEGATVVRLRPTLAAPLRGCALTDGLPRGDRSLRTCGADHLFDGMAEMVDAHKVALNCGRDRFEDHPEPVLELVLSFLPSRDSVRTSVLSPLAHPLEVRARPALQTFSVQECPGLQRFR
ncbi:hypothetical protein ZWY2020_031371 [Hordeum vulgare]|nr:hypothetical protein ZWY2020_031371 [Hordeum vulgare]